VKVETSVLVNPFGRRIRFGSGLGCWFLYEKSAIVFF